MGIFIEPITNTDIYKGGCNKPSSSSSRGGILPYHRTTSTTYSVQHRTHSQGSHVGMGERILRKRCRQETLLGFVPAYRLHTPTKPAVPVANKTTNETIHPLSVARRSPPPTLLESPIHYATVLCLANDEAGQSEAEDQSICAQGSDGLLDLVSSSNVRACVRVRVYIDKKNGGQGSRAGHLWRRRMRRGGGGETPPPPPPTSVCVIPLCGVSWTRFLLFLRARC